MASSSSASPSNNHEDGENINTQTSSSAPPPPPPFEIPIKWPPQGSLSTEWVESLAAVFDWSSRYVAPSELPSVLPVSVFDSLAMSASKILHREPNCLEIDVDSNCSVVLVGDVHGQLHDVLNLLQTAGPPSPSRFFVFNGDYVDRGAWGLETFLLLLAWKLIIRSHEGPDAREKRPGLAAMHKGYTIDHDVQSGKLITLFSAPDYPQFQASKERYNNRGAYIILEPPDFANPNFHTFEAVMPRPKVNAYYDYENVIDSDEDLDLDSISS